MQASSDDLQSLLAIQDVDVQIMKLQKRYEDLPQRKTVMEVRKKREQLQTKHSQVDRLKKDASKRLSRINDEDESLAKKESGVQAAIEAACGDFRHAEARAKELDGISRRRSALSDERAGIDEELEKIGNLQAQLNAAARELDRIEKEAHDEYVQEAGGIQNKMGRLKSKREKLFSDVDAQVANVYRKTAHMLGSIAVGSLEDTRCSVCRSSFDGGRLIDLRKEAPLGVCPSCKRLLIIE